MIAGGNAYQRIPRRLSAHSRVVDWLVQPACPGTLLRANCYGRSTKRRPRMASPDNPILNRPFEAPRRHWSLDPDGGFTTQVLDGRRRSEYLVPIAPPKKSGHGLFNSKRRTSVGGPQSPMRSSMKSARMSSAGARSRWARPASRTKRRGCWSTGEAEKRSRHCSSVKSRRRRQLFGLKRLPRANQIFAICATP